ncbi:hypothetical protein FHT87_005131 [Rhizobium sp. BK316]|nr:hypothetical protein [Rhizobium sp. BK316]
MTDMVTRVARAIGKVADPHTPWNECGSGFKEICAEFARAAIEALREPTEEMLEPFDDLYQAESVWELMINGALREPNGEDERSGE